ncbi:MAG TPA: rhomboid family intramembrane serine protease [Candidatus Didemnitutus sp.]|jgi:rhomboid protease GluP
MSDGTPSPASEIVREISFDGGDGSIRNDEFRGPGQLVIRTDGPTYIFRGEPRALFRGKSAELVLGAGEIADVAVSGDRVRFRSARSLSGPHSGKLFVFRCRDAGEANEVARLLPARIDEAAAATRDFAARLRELGGSSSPWLSVTAAIIAANIIVYVAMGLLGGGWIEANTLTFVRYGANNGAATTDGEWWRLLTSMFMHYGLIHLALNMWALLSSGLFAERLFGRRIFALIYLASGLTGGLATIFWHGDKVWSVGASGAIFGVIGSLFGFRLRQHQSIPASVVQSLTRSTVVFVGYNLFYGFVRTGIDNAAHLGGLAGGILFGWLLALPADRSVRERLAASRLALGAGVLAAIVAGGVVLAPRFDYRVRDALAFSEANQEFGDREAPLLKQNSEGLAQADSPAKEEAHSAWMRSELIPFYEAWDHRLTALNLAPEKATGRTRGTLVAILEERLASYRRLAAGLHAHDPQAAAQFMAEDAAVAKEIEALAAQK